MSLPAEITDPLSGKRIAGQTRNMSRGGCFVLAEGTLDTGAVVELRIERGAETFRTLAAVTRVIPGEGLALAFLGIEPAQAERLEAWLNELARA